MLLSGKNDDDVLVLRSFVEKINFKSMSLVEAMRHFLSLFLIPGESQKISRVLGTS